MAPRPTWQGHLRLSLVTCPVALYTALSAAGDVHFHLINPKTNNRIRMITTDPDTGPVERASLVKGFEVSKGQYVLVTDDEIQAVKLESTKVIDIERFVPAAEVDRIYWDHPYFLVPADEMAQEAFGVIRDAMAKSEQIAIGRVVLSTRERILAIEPQGRGMMAYSLRSAEEVRSEDEIFGGIAKAKPDANMIAIAEKIIEQKSGTFDPTTLTDRYEKALKALIEAKRKGHKPEAIEPPKDTNVIDLLSALKASLGAKAGKQPSGKAGPKRAPASKRTTSRSKAG